MLIGTYRRTRRAIIILRLNQRAIYRNGEMISSQRQTLRFISSSAFVDVTQSIGDTMPVAFCTRLIAGRISIRSESSVCCTNKRSVDRENYRERANYEAAKV